MIAVDHRQPPSHLTLRFFCRVLVRQLLRKRIVIVDPIEVSKDLVEKGYAPEVIAHRIVDGIRTLWRDARSPILQLEDGFELSTSQVDFTVPSAGVSFRDAVRFFAPGLEIESRAARAGRTRAQ